MNTGAPEPYLIPSCSWLRAQRPPSDRSKISQAIVEEPAIESWDCQHPVTGAPYREVNSKVATAPNTQSRR